jgi:glutamate/tyrosine decarboxylase-like PLP-dependent enzyme
MDKFGWNQEESDGIMAAGGSMSNFYGMVTFSSS